MHALNIKPLIIEKVTAIIANHHSPGTIDTLNFKVLYDADWLVNLPEEYNLDKENPQGIKKIIKQLYFTQAAKNEARKLFI